MIPLSWFEFSAVNDGDVLRLVRDYKHWKAGEDVIVIENGLNEIWCSLLMRGVNDDPDDEPTFIAPGLDPGADGREDEAWQAPSPFAKGPSA